MTTPAPALELKSIEKTFGSTVALSAASLVVRPGTLHMLLGENGAGKTTLLRIAAGFERADAGSVLVDGSVARWRTRADAIADGVAAVQQHFSLINAMTVAENVALAGPGLFTAYRPTRAAREVRAISERIGLPVDPDATVGALPVSGQQRVEIVKALARAPRILILDEPTAVLAPAEALALYEWLQKFVDAGNTAIVITHHVREARRYGSAITVLRHGRTVLEVSDRDESEADVVAAILGDRSAVPMDRAIHPRSTLSAGDVVLRATGATVTDHRGVSRIRGATVAVRRGEVLGVAGVDGAGHRELLRALAGRLPLAAGEIERPRSVGFIPEDRLRDALVPDFTLSENFVLRGLGNRHKSLAWDAEERRTGQCIADFDVRGAMPRTRAAALSGGNQQRFVLARELADSPDAIIAENPARGLDIRASAAVLQLLRDRAKGGAGVVVYSSDVEELLQVADRVVVCQGGRLREVVCEADAIGAAMIGAS